MSASIARATASTSNSGIAYLFIFKLLNSFCGNIFLLVFGVHRQKQNKAGFQTVKINYSRPTPLAFSLSRPANFSRTLRTLHYIASHWIHGEPVHEIGQFILAPHIGGLFLESDSFNNRVHSCNCTGNPYNCKQFATPVKLLAIDDSSVRLNELRLNRAELPEDKVAGGMGGMM